MSFLILIGQKNKFLLDFIPSVAIAFSLTKIASKYNGPCFNVRRSSDNAAIDIGFAGNYPRAPFNTAQLLSFVGSGSGFITKWYDQGVTGNHVSQSIAGSQPRIVNTGSLDTINGKPAFFFSGSTFLKNSTPTTAQPFTSMLVASVADTTTTYIFLGGTSGTNALFSSAGHVKINYGTSVSGGANTTNLSVYEGIANSSSSIASVNGSDTTLSAGSNSMTGIEISGWQNGASTLSGYMGEALIFPSLLTSSQRRFVRKNQGAFFGVSVS